MLSMLEIMLKCSLFRVLNRYNKKLYVLHSSQCEVMLHLLSSLQSHAIAHTNTEVVTQTRGTTFFRTPFGKELQDQEVWKYRQHLLILIKTHW